MGFFKRLLGLEKKEEIVKEEVKEELPTDNGEREHVEIITTEEPQREFLNITCELCGKIIGTDKRKKAGGKLFHKSCFKEKYSQLRDQGKVF